MIDQYLEQIRQYPDFILMALAFVMLVALMLFIWRRAGPLGRAADENRNLARQLQEQSSISENLNLELRNTHTRLAGLLALEPQREAQAAELAQAREALAKWQAENARLNEELRQQKLAAETNAELLTKTGDDLRAEFKLLAGQVLETHGEQFEKSNAERLAQTLAPLKDHIGKFEVELRNVHESAGKDRAALKTEIEMLTKRSLEVSTEAHNLTQALKGDQQKQGAWGEMVLASILERSGLREGEEYEIQVHHRDADGNAFRPDVVVNLPGGRRLVVDSKVSLVAYERAVNAESETARGLDMKAHVAAIKSKIDDLSSKKYHQFDDGSVDYVIMFMPIESAFSEAVRNDPKLVLYAADRQVVIASPTNLMLALKTVENLWSVERRNKNALEIARQAGTLYDKFAGFIENLEDVGYRLGQAQAAQDAAMKKLTTGRGNLTDKVETLKKLGAKTEKQISVEFESEDDEAVKPASLPQ
ncbi:MAG: DNA recombination protein RmuC [Rhodobacteraceae bacterium]|nr:DNA recombination protein RmuC [Paracoccaceae bacterium]